MVKRPDATVLMSRAPTREVERRTERSCSESRTRGRILAVPARRAFPSREARAVASRSRALKIEQQVELTASRVQAQAQPAARP